MTEEDICMEECISIPGEIEESIKESGGIAGLVRQIPDDKDIEAACMIHRALADPVRTKILHLLMIQSLCVCVIKAVIKMADSRLSYHLNILKKAGMIEGEQQGYYIIYHITQKGRKFMEKETERITL